MIVVLFLTHFNDFFLQYFDDYRIPQANLSNQLWMRLMCTHVDKHTHGHIHMHNMCGGVRSIAKPFKI